MDTGRQSSENMLGDNSPRSGQHEIEERVSMGSANVNENALNGNGTPTTSVPPAATSSNPYAEQVHSVVNSEIGIQTLLNRLKQSIASAKEFASFLKKRSVLEEEHANGLRKICRATHTNFRGAEHRQGSFAQANEEITRIHDRMADNGLQFAGSLQQMFEDLMEMTTNSERGRKHWKQTGLNAEQRLQDAEAAMRKSKTKYDSVAEDYDRTRTGDRQSGKIFGIKGPKSAAQHEEDLLRKVQAADADYAAKVQNAQASRHELFTAGRPEAVRNLQDLIRECDSALTLQMQKFASFNEKLLLYNGLSVSPMRGNGEQTSKDGRSLREAISAINNEMDMNYYVGVQASKVPPTPAEIKYEKHPVLTQAYNTPSQTQRQSDQAQSYNSRQGPPQSFGGPVQQPYQQQNMQHGTPVQNHNGNMGQSSMNSGSMGQYNAGQGQGSIGQSAANRGTINTPQTSSNYMTQGNGIQSGQNSNMAAQNPTAQRPSGSQYNQAAPQVYAQRDRSSSLGQQSARPSNISGPPQSQYNNFNDQTPRSASTGPQSYSSGNNTSSGAPQLSTLLFQNSSQNSAPYAPQDSHMPIAATRQQQPSLQQQQQQPQQQQQQQFSMGAGNAGNLQPLKPVFGMTLDQLFERDGSAVPMIVYQCIQAVDLYGLEVEGIYRLSGTSSHVTKIRAMFDNDASKVDFRIPEAFFHDVNSVAGLLKQFFRDLPDPLLTAENYADFIDAAKSNDDIIRRDSLHAIINALPDSNYATLRALTLHLNRVTDRSPVNRMNASNLAIVFGPTLMGANAGSNIQDAGWQVRVIETILQNTYQIFDDD